MSIFNIIIGTIFGLFVLWRLIVFIKAKPEALSGASLNKSFSTMGVIALALIVFIGLVVFILRA
jgi:hypothetical protein